MLKRLTIFALAAITALTIACSAWADTVYLKDGRVLEGTITREGDSYLYITVKVGTVERPTLVLKSDITRIERDDAKPAKPAAPDAEQPSKPSPGPAPAAVEPRAESLRSRPAPSPNARRLVFLTLEGEVGPYMNAKALKHSIDLLADEKPDIVVLRFNSDGGALSEIKKLSDVIQNDIKPKYRVVAWIESAISAAAMTAWTCEEIYMMKEGNLGAATAFSMRGGRATAVKGEDLEHIFRLMRRISERGKHNALVMHAMEVPSNLSADIDTATGKVTWRDDLEGQYIVSTKSKILTFNSIDAVKFGVARAIMNNKDELAHALGCSQWVEVGADAEDYQVTFRKDVKQAGVRAGELLQKMQIALKAGNIGRARVFLGQLRGWVRRASSLAEYGAGEFGVPPLNDEFFRMVQEKLDEMAKKQRESRKR